MRSTKAQVRQRVEAVLEVRLSGAEFSDLRRFAQENGWRVSDGQLWRYVRKTDAILAQTLERDREKIFNRHIGQRRALFARAMSVSDYPTCLRILKDEAELFGLYPARSGSQGPEARPAVSVPPPLDGNTVQIIQNILIGVQSFPEAKQAIVERLRLAAQELRQQAAQTNGQAVESQP
jgi:hypothetical protein